MARVVNSNGRSSGGSSTGRITGSSTSVSSSSDGIGAGRSNGMIISSDAGRFGKGSDDSFSNVSTVSDRVRNSPAYLNAFELFSNEPNKIWLQRLISIPSSVVDASETFLDEIGFSNNYADKQAANYQYCIEQINALVAEYQAWKNSLPTTQVEQMASAGINSAITGQGINGSSIPDVGVSSNPSTLQSTNVGDFIFDASSFILDSVSGLSSVVKSFRELGISERSEMVNFNKFLRDEGIEMHTDKNYNSLRQLFKGIDRGDAVIFSDPKGDTIRLNNVVEKLLSNDAYAPLVKRWQERQEKDEQFDTELSGLYGSSLTSDMHMVGIDAVTDAEYSNFLVETKRAYLQNKLSINASRNDLSIQETDKISKELNNELFKLQMEQMKIKLDLIQKLKGSSSMADQLLLQKVLLGFNATDQSILGTNLDFMQSEKALGIIGSILGIFK